MKQAARGARGPLAAVLGVCDPLKFIGCDTPVHQYKNVDELTMVYGRYNQLVNGDYFMVYKYYKPTNTAWW